MKKTLLSVLVLALFVFLGVVSLAAQEAEKPEAEAAPKAANAGKKTPWSKPETLSGTISSVQSADKLVIVTSSAGVPYNFKVSGATKIKIGDQKGKLDDLSGATNKQVSVAYVPTRTGNMARSIEVSQ
jgi:ABC-type amino acid transport substrate-binding protein